MRFHTVWWLHGAVAKLINYDDDNDDDGDNDNDDRVIVTKPPTNQSDL